MNNPTQSSIRNPQSIDVASLRKNYARQSLSETDVLPDPIAQFAVWFEEALNSQLLEPNAMTLATADRQGCPSARTVLLKGFDKQGFVFYTNYESRKGQALAENPQAALLFTWLELERQIRIEGTVEKVAPETSLAYFQSRPKNSQIGAWASPQSRVIDGRTVLEQQVKDLTHQYAMAEALPLPPFWGGYLVRPALVEFWQGRENRLHDRICYTQQKEGWKIERLAP
jgi:pyridoxamine 5'-phosphate oxidase